MNYLMTPRSLGCLSAATAAGASAGAGTGAAVGLAGGPLAEVTAPGGATAGFGIGGVAGFGMGMSACMTGRGNGGGGRGSGRQSSAGKVKVTFGHGARHLAGTGLQQEQVENATKAQVEEIAGSSSSTGNFWGTVQVSGQDIYDRAYSLADGTISIGTYTVGAS